VSCINGSTSRSLDAFKSSEKTPWPASPSELYRPGERHLSAKLVPTFVDIGCHVVSVTAPYGRILDFLLVKVLCPAYLEHFITSMKLPAVSLCTL
jgi:hypothetical protein